MRRPKIVELCVTQMSFAYKQKNNGYAYRRPALNTIRMEMVFHFKLTHQLLITVHVLLIFQCLIFWVAFQIISSI